METSKKKNQSFILMFLALFVMVAICISVVPYSTAYAATTESISLNAKVFVSGDNLLTISKFSGMDPEVGLGAGGGTSSVKYPISRKILFGVNVSF